MAAPAWAERPAAPDWRALAPPPSAVEPMTAAMPSSPLAHASGHYAGVAAGQLSQAGSQLSFVCDDCDAVTRSRYAPAERPHWMFHQSYYSHELAAAEWADPILPSSRTQYRVPTVGTNPGFASRSRYRVNTFVLRNGLNSFDVTYQYQGNVELQP